MESDYYLTSWTSATDNCLPDAENQLDFLVLKFLFLSPCSETSWRLWNCMLFPLLLRAWSTVKCEHSMFPDAPRCLGLHCVQPSASSHWYLYEPYLRVGSRHLQARVLGRHQPSRIKVFRAISKMNKQKNDKNYKLHLMSKVRWASWIRWLRPLISIFRRLRQEDLLLFETSLDYIVPSKTSWAKEWDLVLKKGERKK